MNNSNKPATEVISFRVPEDFFKKVNKQARKAKKKRAIFVETLFTQAFEQYLATQTLEKQGA